MDEEAGRAAWVEWRERDAGRVVDARYHLKARDRLGVVARWEIETYNPYFGCRALPAPEARDRGCPGHTVRVRTIFVLDKAVSGPVI